MNEAHHSLQHHASKLDSDTFASESNYNICMVAIVYQVGDLL